MFSTSSSEMRIWNSSSSSIITSDRSSESAFSGGSPLNAVARLISLSLTSKCVASSFLTRSSTFDAGMGGSPFNGLVEVGSRLQIIGSWLQVLGGGSQIVRVLVVFLSLFPLVPLPSLPASLPCSLDIASYNRAEHAVDEAAGVVAAELLCQLDRLVDHRLDRRLLGLVDQNLVERDAQNRLVHAGHLADGPARRGFLDDAIEVGVVLPDAKHELSQESLALGGEELVLQPAGKHLVGRVVGRIQLEQRLKRDRADAVPQTSHCWPPRPG